MLEWLVLLKPLYSWVGIPVVIVPAKEERKTLVFTFERLKDDLNAIVDVGLINSISKNFYGWIRFEIQYSSHQKPIDILFWW